MSEQAHSDVDAGSESSNKSHQLLIIGISIGVGALLLLAIFALAAIPLSFIVRTK